MNILEFKMYYEPEIAAGIALDSNTAEDLAKRGHNVKLYVPTPSRGVTRKQAKNVSKIEKKENDHLIIYRYTMYPEHGGIIQRVIRYFLCSIKQLWFGLTTKDIDLIFAGSTPPFQGLICNVVKKIRKVPFVYNCQDIFPDSMVTAGITKEDSFIFKIGNWISNVTYKSADSIIVISEQMKENLLKKRVSGKKIHVVSNWVDENLIFPINKESNSLYSELGIKQYPFMVVYAGNIGYAQAIDIIIEAADKLKDNNQIGFILFGNGAMKDQVLQMIEEKNLKNVQIFPLQPYEKVSEVYSLGDACIVSCKKGTGGNAMPSKTWSIMGCGRPILASFDKETLLQEVIEEYSCGMFAEAGDVSSLVDNILFLNQNIDIAYMQGKNARSYIETHLTRQIGTGKIIKIIENTYKRGE